MKKHESGWEFRRRRAVELSHEGYCTKDIAHFLDVTPQSIYSWLRKARSGLPLNPVPCGGRPRRLNDDQIAELRRLMEQGAVANGWPNDIWTIPRVREMVQRHFQLTVSWSNAWYIVRKYLGWTSQKPITKLRDRDEQKIAQWPNVQFKRILGEAQKKEAYLAFIDESGFMLMPTLRKTYAPKGQTPVVRTCDPHGRISTACAITVSPKSQRANVYYQMLADDANFTGRSVARFIDLLSDTLSSRVIIIWDCIPIHLAKPVRAVLRKKGTITLRMLPKYAPDLNPADKVWAHIKYGRLANFAPSDMKQLRSTVKDELVALKRRTDLLHSFIRAAGLDIKAVRRPTKRAG